MDQSHLRRFPRLLATPGARRDILRGLAAFPVFGATLLRDATALAQDGGASEPIAADELDSQARTRGNRRFFCLKGRTIRARGDARKERLQRRGAKPGKCKPRCKPIATGVASFGTVGGGTDNFTNPRSVTVAAGGLVAYVADADNDRISIWSRPDASSQVWGNLGTFGTPSPGPRTFDAPADVALSNNDLYLYVADFANDRIAIWTRPDATAQDWTYAASFGQARLVGPVAVTLGPGMMTMFVAEQGADQISVYTRPNIRSTSWRLATTIGSTGADPDQLAQPSDVAVAPDGRTIWIADSGNNRIAAWTRPALSSMEWTAAYTIGEAGPGPGQLANPVSVALAPDQKSLYISDATNNRVSVWTRSDKRDRKWTPLTTLGGPGGGPEQLANPGQLRLLRGTKLLWIADTGNNRVVVWSVACPA